MLHCTIPVLARENAQRYPRVRAHLSVAFARLKAPLAPRPMVCNAAADTVTGIPLACVVVAAPPPEPRKHVTVLGGFTKAKRSAKPKHHKAKSLSTSQARKPVHTKHLFSHTLGVNDASRALHTNTHPRRAGGLFLFFFLSFFFLFFSIDEEVGGITPPTSFEHFSSFPAVQPSDQASPLAIAASIAEHAFLSAGSSVLLPSSTEVRAVEIAVAAGPVSMVNLSGGRLSSCE